MGVLDDDEQTYDPHANGASTARRKSLSSSACRNAHKNRRIPPASLAEAISLIPYVLWHSKMKTEAYTPIPQ